MSIDPTDAASAGDAHPILTCATTLTQALDAVAHVDPSYLPGAGKREALLALGVIAARVEELRLRGLAAGAVLGDVAADDGSRDASAWLAHAAHLDPSRARRLVRMATSSTERWTVAGAALREGRLDLARAEVVVRSLDELPEGLDPDLLRRAEACLVDEAQQFDPRRLRILGRRVLAYLAPDVADAHEARMLANEDIHAAAVTFMRLRSRGDGTTDLHARVADHIARRLETYLHAFTSPRQPDSHAPCDHPWPAHSRQTQSQQTHEGADHFDPSQPVPDAEAATEAEAEAATGPGVSGMGRRADQPRAVGDDFTTRSAENAAGSPAHGVGNDPPMDRRPWDRRLGEAFGTFLESVDPDRMPLHGGDATTVVVTIDHATLMGDLRSPPRSGSSGPAAAAAGRLGAAIVVGAGPGVALIGDQPISAAHARRLACTAGVLPAVLGGASQVLDLGHRRRFFTAAQRRALALSNPACAAYGCTIPAPWCEAHHAGRPWSRGGRTDLADGVLLCSHHHHRAHDPRYETTRHHDGTVQFIRRTRESR